MFVGIYGEEDFWLDKIDKLVRREFGRVFGNLEVRLFQKREQMLKQYKGHLDVLFLDLDLQKQDGLEIADIVNNKWGSCHIVYYTNNLQYALDVYDTFHIFFFLKDQLDERMESVLLKVMRLRQLKRKRLFFSVIGGGKIVLSPDEILYFERIKRSTQIVTIHGEYEIKEKLSDLEVKFTDQEFIRCHNSYMVHLPGIREMQKSAFIMKNGTQVIISRSYSKKVKEAFEIWQSTNI